MPTQPAPRPKKLTLAKETLRRLTPADLRLAVGGEAHCLSRCFCPTEGLCAPTPRTAGCWTWNCPAPRA